MSSIPRQPHHHAPPTSSCRNAPPNIDLPTASSPHICPWRRYWLHNHHLALPGNHPCLPIIPQPTSGTLSASTCQPRLTPSCLLNSPTSAPMTPGNMSTRDVPCSLRSEAQQPRPPDADSTPCPTSLGATTTAAGPSTSLVSQSTGTAPPRFERKVDALTPEVVDQPSQFLRDVQSLLERRRSQNPSRQVARRMNYHDFSSSDVQPPPLFQSWVNKLINKSGS